MVQRQAAAGALPVIGRMEEEGVAGGEEALLVEYRQPGAFEVCSLLGVFSRVLPRPVDAGDVGTAVREIENVIVVEFEGVEAREVASRGSFGNQDDIPL